MIVNPILKIVFPTKDFILYFELKIFRAHMKKFMVNLLIIILYFLHKIKILKLYLIRKKTSLIFSNLTTNSSMFRVFYWNIIISIKNIYRYINIIIIIYFISYIF